MQKRLNILNITILMLLTTVSISSCRKEPLPDPSDDAMISFDSSVGKTKALVNSVTDMSSFKVYGYYTIDGTSSSTVFDGTEVTRAGSTWGYSPARYWIPEAKYSFAGFHPSDATITMVNPDIDANGVFEGLSFEYQKPDVYDDFMLATASMTSAAAKTNNYEVELAFEHLLSNIKINVGFADDVQNGTYIRINRVEINGMKSSGTYTVGSGWSELSTTSLQLSNTLSDVLLHKDGGNLYNNSTALTDNVLVLTGTEGLTVIPVDLTNNSNVVKISLYCEISNDGTNYTSKKIEKTIRATANVSEWEEGKSYTYKALLDVDYSISFSEPTITAWEDEQATGSVIIK